MKNLGIDMPGVKIIGFLRRKAAEHTAAHLERNAQGIAEAWKTMLIEQIPVYRCLPEPLTVVDFGQRASLCVAGLLRADTQFKGDTQDAMLFQLGVDEAVLRLSQGFELDEIIRGLTLFRQVLQDQTHLLLRSRFWIVIPSHFVTIEAKINQAVDLCMLAVAQSYLKARDQIIHQREQELELTNTQLVTLNQEMHHRIRNNLQMVADLLFLGMNQEIGKTPQECLRESFSRVKSIAAVHDLLSVDNVSTTDIKELSSNVAQTALTSMLDPKRQVTITVDGSSVFLPSRQATALAIIVNELVSNSLEHGYKDRLVGSIHIGVASDNNNVEIAVVDDGAGLPKDFDVECSPNLGLQIVKTLVKNELNGELLLQSNCGTTATVRFCR